MKALIVGAGAVGQVYALGLARAGVDVSFFVKKKHAGELRKGIVLHRLYRRRHETGRLEKFGVVTSVDEVSATRWDQIWLAISSDALRGELAAGVLRAAGDATVIVLQADLYNAEYVRGIVPRGQVVEAEIPFISFTSPLPGREGPAGMAVYMPPLLPTPLAGADGRVGPVMDVLRKGGMRARQVNGIALTVIAGAGLGYSILGMLDANRWDLHGLPRNGSGMKAGLAAAREGMAIGEAEAGIRLPAAARLFLQPAVWRAIVPVLPYLFPFDIEVYLRVHFTKVGHQVRWVLDTYIEMGEKRGLPVQALRALRGSMQPLPVHAA